MFEGLLYVATAYGKVVALDPASGSEEWVFDAAVNRGRNYSEVANRGVTAWRDAQARSTDACASRVFLGTIDARLVAIDARTGRRCADFGEGGEVDLTTGVQIPWTPNYQNYLVTSPPVVPMGAPLARSPRSPRRDLFKSPPYRTRTPRWNSYPPTGR